MKNRNKNPFKKVAVAILCGIVFGLFLVPNGCDKLRNLNLDGLDISKIPIPLTDRSLDGFEHYWYNMKADSVYIINSQPELLTYFCGYPHLLPTIDFNQNTVLLVQGYTGYTKYAITSITEDLRQVPKNGYKLNIEIMLDYDAIVPTFHFRDSINWRWAKAIIVPKTIQSNETINYSLNISQLDENNLPESIIQTKNILGLGYASYNIPKKNTLYIINDVSSLLAYIPGWLGSYPDFSQYSILAAIGSIPTELWYITKKLEQLPDSNYRLTINVFESGAARPDWWYVVLITKKLNQGDDVKFIINNKYF